MLLCAVVRLTAPAGVKETMGEPGFLMCSLSIHRGRGYERGGLGNVKSGWMEFVLKIFSDPQKKLLR